MLRQEHQRLCVVIGGGCPEGGVGGGRLICDRPPALLSQPECKRRCRARDDWYEDKQEAYALLHHSERHHSIWSERKDRNRCYGRSISGCASCSVGDDLEEEEEEDVLAIDPFL